MTSPLSGDELELRPVSLSAEQATELRRYASRKGRPMPISRYELDLYTAKETRTASKLIHRGHQPEKFLAMMKT